MTHPTAQVSPKLKAPAPDELTPRDDLKKQVSEVLKRVDQLIRHGDLLHAQKELVHAKAIDPRNVYAQAFEERIENLMVQESDSKLAAAAKRRAEEDAQKRFEEDRRKAEEARDRARKEAAAVVPKSNPVPVDKEAILETLQQEESKRKQTRPTPPSPVQATTPTPVPQGSHDDDLRIYREYLDQAWADGIPTPEERKQMEQLRAVMNVTGDEHVRIQQESRLHSYIVALRRAVMGSRSGPSSSAHAQLRVIFSISNEEHQQIETRMLADLKKNRRKASVVIIDDDARLLELLAQAIASAGFESIAVPTSDEAYALMRQFRPDLILCDINLESSTMGGFTFYEKIQEVPHLQDVPFIFLTGLTDEVLVRAGKELGVDDYLMKPISEQLLVSTLRGKLKRYRQLRASIPRSSAA